MLEPETPVCPSANFVEIAGTKRRQSTTISQLVRALVAVQKAVPNPKKSSTNPHFRSNYADLTACADVCRKPLTDNGLAVLAFPSAEGSVVSVETLLAHTSGEWISATISAEAKKGERGEGVVPDTGPQSVVAAITYLRRAGLSALVFLTPEEEDDDGNRAEGRETKDAPRYEKLASAFRTVGVTIQMLETKLGHALPDTTEQEYDPLLTGVFEAIKGGDSIEKHFYPLSPKTAPLAVDHTPAKGTDEPRPGEKRHRTKTKKPDPAPPESAPLPNEVIEPVPTPPAETPVPEPLAYPYARPLSPEERKAVRLRVNALTAKVPDAEKLKVFILVATDRKEIKDITKHQWDTTLDLLEAAAKEGHEKLVALVSRK